MDFFDFPTLSFMLVNIKIKNPTTVSKKYKTYWTRPESIIVPSTLTGFGYSRKAQRNGKINTSAITIKGAIFLVMISIFLSKYYFVIFLYYKDILNQIFKI
jgi:hypothetical protein